jgi:hypothetical protein
MHVSTQFYTALHYAVEHVLLSLVHDTIKPLKSRFAARYDICFHQKETIACLLVKHVICKIMVKQSLSTIT